MRLSNGFMQLVEVTATLDIARLSRARRKRFDAFLHRGVIVGGHALALAAKHLRRDAGLATVALRGGLLEWYHLDSAQLEALRARLTANAVRFRLEGAAVPEPAILINRTGIYKPPEPPPGRLNDSGFIYTPGVDLSGLSYQPLGVRAERVTFTLSPPKG